MSSTDSGFAPSDQTRVRRFDRVCDEFEAAWREGGVPPLEEFLSRVAADLRAAVFVELLSLDLEYRVDQGLPASAEEYERRFPEFRAEVGAAFERLGSTKIRISTLASRRRLAVSVPGRLGDYELQGEIGHGGMGVVFKARQVSLDRVVALKVIRGDGFLADEAVRRFQTEARAAAGLRHPGIVQVHDVGADGPYRYFSMEYVEGRTLSDVCATGGVTSQQAARSLVELSAAVEFAHEQGILHRDLKPSNVLVDRDGRLRIADFGLAKQMADSDTVTSLGQILGTPAYMSPEQARGEQGLVDGRSDVYSLGGVLYALLTGRPPFQGRSPIDTLVQVIHDPPCAPRELNPQVAPALEAICLKCLNKDREFRYPSARALRVDLARFLEGQTALPGGAHDTAGSVSAVGQDRADQRDSRFRRRLAVALFISAAALLSAGLIYQNSQDAANSSSAAASAQASDGAENSSQTSPLPAKSQPDVPRPLHPGAPDPEFGDPEFGEGEGTVHLEQGKGGGLQDAYALALQPDGKIVVAGQVERSRGKNARFMAIARLLPDGSFDKSFNQTGKFLFWFGIFDDGMSGRRAG